MSKLAKKIGKNSIIAATALDLLGILLSFLVNNNLTNDFLLKIVLFCYCIRFELIAILLIIGVSFLFLRFSKSALKSRPIIYNSIILIILVAVAFSIKPAKQYIIARDYYFSNEYYKDESQKRFLDNANDCLKKNEWDLFVDNVSHADVLYPGHYTSRINKAVENAKIVMSYGERLHDSYIKPVVSHIPLNSFKCAQTLSKLYPSKYEKEYLEFRDSVVNAINSYQQLYDAVSSDDYKSCRELINLYGWCWFEPTINTRLSYDNEQKVMEWVNEYLGKEDFISAQSRLVNNWFGRDSIETIIY